MHPKHQTLNPELIHIRGRREAGRGGGVGRSGGGGGGCSVCCLIFDRSERSARLLTRQEAEAISDSILKLLQLYEQMIKLSVPRSCPRYKVIPKMHVLLHIVEDVVETRWNYRHYHCFIEGDVIGQLKDLTVKLPKVGLGYCLLSRWLLRLGASKPIR